MGVEVGHYMVGPGSEDGRAYPAPLKENNCGNDSIVQEMSFSIGEAR